MNSAAEKVVSEALDLPPVLRAFVAEKLIESLDFTDASELSAKWRKEIRRRCIQVDRDAVKLSDAETVFAKAYASLA